MTITQEESASGVRSISAEQAAADKLQDGPDREVALFRIAELRYIRGVQAARSLADTCNKIELLKDGVVNPQRPYLIWDCCDVHRTLANTRSSLNWRALRLGVERLTDNTIVIED